MTKQSFRLLLIVLHLISSNGETSLIQIIHLSKLIQDIIQMQDHLNLVLLYNHQKKQYKIHFKQNQVFLSLEEILRRVKDFLQSEANSVSTYLTYWVQWGDNKGIKENLFKMYKKGIQLKLTETQCKKFQLKIYIEQGSEKMNLIKSFNQNFENYQRIKGNIERIISQTADEKYYQQKNTRPIDIAFLFADPLVEVIKAAKNPETKPKNEVSYQVQYDKFIEMVKGEEFKRNLRIEMMVATQTNIKNVLSEGASILHFACHGQTNYLQIQNEKKIGELVNLEKQKLLQMISSISKPKVIIFNACKSQLLAREISRSKSIITIGYKGNAKDEFCEKFTKDFYMGVFVEQRPVRETFNKIKQQITILNQTQGNKLSIFPEVPKDFEVDKISESPQQNINYVVKWKMLENLRKDDCLGVKQEMYNFINKLTNNQSMSYIFLKGDKNTGKSNFIKKTRIYTINRKVFSDEIFIDLKKKNGQYTQTLLQMRLDHEALLLAWRSKVENKFKNGRVSCLLVIDHCYKIIQNQYSDFTKYIEQQIKQKFKWGKIVIITRNVNPYSQNDFKRFLKAICHKKLKQSISDKEMTFFISRYFDTYRQLIQAKYKLTKDSNMIAIAKALKQSSSINDFEELLKKNQEKKTEQNQDPKSIQENEIQEIMGELDEKVRNILQNVNIEIKENHHMYLSTIFEEIADKNYHKKHHVNSEHSKTQNMQIVFFLVQKFKELFQRAFFHQRQKSILCLKHLTMLSFKIAGVCYLTECLFKEHLLNCEKLRVLAVALLLNPYQPNTQKRPMKTQQNDKSHKNVESILKQYRVKLLLTLYTYFTECQAKVKHQKQLPQQIRLDLEECSKKDIIIQNELYEQIYKIGHQSEVQNSLGFLTRYKIMNKIIQQIHYNPEYTNLHQNHEIGRKYSDFELSAFQDYINESTQQISTHHAKIDEYWKTYQSMKEINMKGHNEILSKDSMVILFLNIIKLINFNLLELEYLQSKGQSFFKREIIDYIGLYVNILKTIDQSQVFSQRTLSHSGYIIWKFPKNESIKMLFKKYFRLFINVYFQLQKIRQNLTKDYSLKIFNHILKQCDSHPQIKMGSIKNDIQTHKNEQFLGNYSCQTYIAIPLVSFNKNDDKNARRINMKRFQSHIFNFQQSFFAKLERQIKKDIFLLNKELFTEQQRPQMSLIQLLICNCKDDYIQCQTTSGKRQKLEKYKIRSLPNAPIVIIFGTNVKDFFDKLYQNQESILITIDLDQEDYPTDIDLLGKWTKNQSWEVIEKRISNLQSYALKLQMSYSLLEYFYTSFCKHFFTVDHSSFYEQVRSSFHLAKAEALIKTKIRFEGYGKNQSNYSNKGLSSQVSKIEMSINNSIKNEVMNKSAYHFMFKFSQINVLKFIGTLAMNQKDNIEGEVGCNCQIYELLTKIQSINYSAVFVFTYKSNEMKRNFMNTLLCKLKKSKKYSIQNEAIFSQNLLLSRKSDSRNDKTIGFQQQRQRQIFLQQQKIVKIYQNLTEQQFQNEYIYFSQKDEPVTIRIFLSKIKYQKPEFKIKMEQQYIQQSYDFQKLQYQLFYVDLKKQKPNANPKTMTKGFKNFIANSQSFGGLDKLRDELQNKRNH